MNNTLGPYEPPTSKNTPGLGRWQVAGSLLALALFVAALFFVTRDVNRNRSRFSKALKNYFEAQSTLPTPQVSETEKR